MLTWTINELVAESRREEERRQAAIKQAADAFLAYYEQRQGY